MTAFPRFLVAATAVTALLASSCGFKRKKYENPSPRTPKQP